MIRQSPYFSVGRFKISLTVGGLSDIAWDGTRKNPAGTRVKFPRFIKQIQQAGRFRTMVRAIVWMDRFASISVCRP